MGRVRLRLLGGFGLEVDGEERGADLPARARALVAFLALQPGTAHDRQRVAFLFWPDSTEAQARTNLRNVLHHLRRAGPDLEALVDARTGTLRWAGGDDVEVDVAAMEADIAAGDLRAAVARYHGDLLEGSYEDWVTPDRERLRDLFLGALRDLTETLLGGHDAVASARELVRRDPLDEDHHRLLIAAHTAAGDRAGAVRAYHECVAVLARELGVEPSAVTNRAYAAALRDDPDDDLPAAAAAGPGSAPAPAALVGREREWTAVTACWESAAARPHLVLVTGEPGVGKTRLVEDLAAWCARRGAAVLRARAYATEGELGFGTVVEWLRAPELASTFAGLAPADRAELARLLPELTEGLHAPPGNADDGDRTRLFAAASRAITSIGRPVLLVADDAHWCDGPSLQFVHYLVRSPAAVQLLVAATARAEDVDQQHPLTAVTQGLRVLDRSTEVALERLGASATADLAVALGAGALDDAARHLLHRETEGNPLFVVEAVRAGWDGRAGHVDLSPKLQAVIAGRLRTLSEPAREAVAVAAVVGRAFSADLVGTASDLDDVGLVRSLDELWRRGIIRGHGAGDYDFSHGRLRDAAYDSIGPAARDRLHLRVAEGLIATASEPSAVSGRIAAHFDHAGRAPDAVSWYQQAAARAMRMGNQAESVRVLERARELAGALPGTTGDATELAVLTALPAALGVVDGFASDRIVEVQQRAGVLAGRLGVELPASMLRSLVMASLCRDEFADAAGAAERLREVGTASRDRSLVLEAAYLAGVTAFWSGDLPTAVARFDEVVDGFDPDRHPDVERFGQDSRIVCLSRRANALWLLGRPDEAVATRDRALALAAALVEPVTREIVHIFAAFVSLDLDDVDAFRRCAAVFADDRVRAGPHLVKGEALLGVVDVLEGRADHGTRRIEAAFDRCGGRNLAPGFRACLLRLLVAAQAAAGDHRATVSAADRAIALAGTRLWDPEVRRLRAVALASTGRTEEARDELDRAGAAASSIGAPGAAAKVDATRETISKRLGAHAARP